MALIGDMGIAGEISEVRRSGGELHLDWKIPGFLDLPGVDLDHYESPPFGFHDARWRLRVWPDWVSSETVRLSLWREFDAGPSTRTVILTLGVRGSGGGVGKRTKEREREFEKGDGCNSGVFCERSELVEQRERLAPGGVLTVVCQMRVPGTAATGSSSSPDVPNRTDTQTGEPNARACKCQALDKQDASTQTDTEFKEAGVDGKLSSEKQDTLDDGAKEKLNGNTDLENDDESRKKKNLNQLSRVKKTKKISLPARHGDVIRSLKAMLAGGRRADFSLKSGGGEWRVHRAILEGRSGHFGALFRGEWAERDEGRLDDVPEGALAGVLHFAYAGEVGDLSPESVCGTRAAARRFDMRDLESLCVECMGERMGPEMVCGALAVAEGDLKQRALECFFRESGTICETDGWRELKEKHPAIIGELFREFIRRERKKREKE